MKRRMKPAPWPRAKKRIAQQLHRCVVCGQDIKSGTEYLDARYTRKAHISCYWDDFLEDFTEERLMPDKYSGMCIGGAGDGEHYESASLMLEVPYSYYRERMADSLRREQGPANRAAVEKTTYKYEVLCMEDAHLGFWVPSHMTFTQAFQRILDVYREAVRRRREAYYADGHWHV